MSSYDESLLASAPKATRSQLQVGLNWNKLLFSNDDNDGFNKDGYNADLLVERKPSTPTSSAVDPELAANYRLPLVQQEREESPLPLTKQKVPFYRTRNGIIIIIVAVVVIIAVVVGGAVGGTRKKGSTSSTAAQLSSTTTSASGNAQGFATSVASSSSSTSFPGQSLGTTSASPSPSTSPSPGQGVST